MTTLLDRLTAALDERLSQYAIGRGNLARDLAVLALETMREPDEEMIESGCAALDLDCHACHMMWFRPEPTWRAMINAALGVK